MFIQGIRVSLSLLAFFTLLLGIAYPLIVTGLAQILFPKQAAGSLLIGSDRKIIGSEFIGQSFSKPEYFWGRLSSTGPLPYNAAASSGSNLGVNSKKLEELAKARLEALHKYDDNNSLPIPIDLITASASGLDPDITPLAAYYQASRIAKIRGMSLDEVNNLIKQNTQSRQFGILGEERINIVILNHLLDTNPSQK